MVQGLCFKPLLLLFHSEKKGGAVGEREAVPPGPETKEKKRKRRMVERDFTQDSSFCSSPSQ